MKKTINRLQKNFSNFVQSCSRWWAFKTSPVVKSSIRMHSSKSGKYVLTIESIRNRRGRSNFTRGIVKNAERKTIATIERDTNRFPYAFVENHEDGHDYLICGDYPGQTVVQLDTKKSVTYLSNEDSVGFEFCWAEIHPSPNGRTLAVGGCHWACPYEITFYDFSNPMMLPYPEISQDFDHVEFLGWTAPDEAIVGRLYEVSIKHGKRKNELNLDQLKEIENENDEGSSWRTVTDEIIWKREQ